MSVENSKNYIAAVEFDDEEMEATFTVPNKSTEPLKISFKAKLKRAGVEESQFSSGAVQVGWRAFKFYASTARSFETTSSRSSDLAKISSALLKAGITNPDDLQVETSEIANVINASNAPNLRPFVDGFLRDDREALRPLLVRQASAETQQKEPYSDDEQDEIVLEAMAHLAELEETVRSILLDLGFTSKQVEGRNHWNIPVDEILKKARARDEKRPKDQQVATLKLEYDWRDERTHVTKWSSDRQVDYALLNLDSRPRRMPDHLDDPGRAVTNQIRSALFPRGRSLTCVAVLMTLAGDRGYNLQTIEDLGVGDVVYLGGDLRAVKMLKTRNRTRWQELGLDPLLSRDSRFNSFGGLIAFLEMVTRFTRHRNKQLLAEAGRDTKLANKFFKSAARRDLPITAATLTNLPNGKTIEFRKLRRNAGKSGIENNPTYLAAGQTIETADRNYLQFYLDDSTRFDLSEQQQQRLIAGLPEESEDLGHTVCTTGANLIDEDGDSTPCLQGPVACMACPNGVRLEAHLPILDVLAEDVCVTVLEADIPEWMRGEVSLLQRLAREQIKIHPASFPVVEDEQERQQVRINLTTLLTSWRKS